MKILKNFPKLYIVNGVFCLVYILTSTLHGYLRNKSGYPITFDNGGYFVWGALIFLAFLAYSAIGLAVYYAMENKKLFNIISVAFLAFSVYACRGSYKEFYNHYKNSYLMKNERYAIVNISYDDIENLKDDNYVIYLADGENLEIEETLSRVSTEWPVKIFQYETDGKTNDFSDKSGVTALPAVVVIVKGKPDKILTGDEINAEMRDTLRYYTCYNTYFTYDI